MSDYKKIKEILNKPPLPDEGVHELVEEITGLTNDLFLDKISPSIQLMAEQIDKAKEALNVCLEQLDAAAGPEIEDPEDRLQWLEEVVGSLISDVQDVVDDLDKRLQPLMGQRSPESGPEPRSE